MIRHGLVAFGLLLAAGFMGAAGAAGPAPALRLFVDPGCGDGAAAGTLTDVLETRLGRPVSAADADEAEVGWRRQSAECVVTSAADASAAVPLPAGAGPEAIRSAAIRVAFLMTMAGPVESTPLGAGFVPWAEANPEPAFEPAFEMDPPPLVLVPEMPATPDGELLPSADSPTPQASPPASAPHVPGSWRVSVLPGLSSYGSHPPGTMPSLSVNLLAGRSSGVAGVEVGLLANAVQGHLYGMQATVGVNHVGHAMEGVQVSGVANVNTGHTRGLQVAGAVNVAAGALDGGQVSGSVNYAGGASRGVQVAPMNLARDLNGVQGGVLNFARDVGGAQLGLVNVARSVDAPIGLVNVVRSEPLLVVGGVSSGRFASVGLKHGGRRLRYLYLAGLHLSEDVGPFGAGFGVSLHAPVGRFFFDLDAVAWQLLATDPLALGALYEMRAVAGWQITRRVAIQAGPVVKVLVAPTRDGFLMPPAWAVSDALPDGNLATAWPELFLGFSF